jgi:hypothetical protein
MRREVISSRLARRAIRRLLLAIACARACAVLAAPSTMNHQKGTTDAK